MIEWLLLQSVGKMAAPASAATFAMLVCGMVAGSAVTTVDPDGGLLPVLQSPCRFCVVETVTRENVQDNFLR